MTARKAKAGEAKVDTPAAAAAAEPEIAVAGPATEPRYEAINSSTGHEMIEDPDTHVRHCKHCHAPEHMAAIRCDPREFT